MTPKVSVVVEQDEQGCYAWCPELKGCQSQGKTVEETLTNIRQAIELFLETLTVIEVMPHSNTVHLEHFCDILF
jgi:predicted RNase H-like HicB family nuclease